MTGQNRNIRIKELSTNVLSHRDPMKYECASWCSWKCELEAHTNLYEPEANKFSSTERYQQSNNASQQQSPFYATFSKQPHKFKHYELRFEVFMVVTMKNAIFWDFTWCGSCKNQHFGGAYRLHHPSIIFRVCLVASY
jgi:hypothetical protein